jgi:hypothetical protein
MLFSGRWSRPLRLTLLAIGLLLVLVPPSDALHLSYSFDMIAETGGQFFSFGFLSNAPGIGNDGAVVFTANTSPFLDAGLYAGDGFSLDPVIAPAYVPLISDGVAFGVSERGSVIFTGVDTPRAVGSSTVVVDGTRITPLFTGDVTYGSGCCPVVVPSSINNSDTVAFSGSILSPLAAFPENRQRQVGVFTTDGMTITTIAKLGIPSIVLTNPLPAINNRGQVAFAVLPHCDGFCDADGQLFSDISPEIVSGGVFVGDGVHLAAIPTDTGAPAGSFLASPDINDHGQVAWATPDGVFVGDHDGTRLITPFGVDLGLAPSSFHGGNVAINNRGMVVFEAVGSGGLGIYDRGQRVIGVGDPLFGSMVTGLEFFRDGLNDRGQIAFSADLADGRSVIVRASPGLPLPH